MTTEDVAFDADDGTTLRGVLHLPTGEEPTPGVVMIHGFSAVKEMGLAPYAEAFRDAGLAVLVYDHRNLGASDGTPRQRIDPWAQARDLRAALGFLGDRPEIDADRLGLWGSSFAGGVVLVVAACDPRVRAVVANVPFAAIDAAGYDRADGRFEAICAELRARPGEGSGEVLGPTPVVTEPGGPDGFLAEPESAEWFLREGRRPGCTWRNEMTLAARDEPVFDPGVCVAEIAPTPLLMVVAAGDRVAPVELARAAFERAGDPKALVTVAGHHFAPYDEPGRSQALPPARDFLVDALARSGT